VGLILAIGLARVGARPAAWLALVALLAVAAVIAITLAVEVPIDNQIRVWTVETLPTDWEAIRSRWANFHLIRTFLSVFGLAAAIGAAVLPLEPRERVSANAGVLQEPGTPQ
jgi:anthrone oxygenase-like protein